MSDHDATIHVLWDAVRKAPENTELILHLGNLLWTLQRFDQAVELFRDAVRHSPDDVDRQLGLAETYLRRGDISHAGAIVETLVEHGKNFPPVMLLSAKLLHREGNVSGAVARYQEAVADDDSLRDEAFENLLGIGVDWDSDEELLDGRLRATETPAPAASTEIPVERPGIDFDQVGGMEEIKEQIRLKIIHPLNHAEMYATYGKTIGGGLLMYGPPGCGKTHLARATAGEVKAAFLSVGISDVLEMWIGQSERNLHDLFERARRSQPAVLFFDEVDALGASRSDMRQSAGRHLINQFLSELDGIEASNDGLLILGATNTPWHLDTAFRRPGRFDRVLFVPPPDPVAREEILRLELQNKPTEDLNLSKVAAKTDRYSGADLKAVVETAIEAKLQEAIKTGKPSPIRTKDLLVAVKTIKPSTAEWFATARNHALYSNASGMYDDILDYLKLS